MTVSQLSELRDLDLDLESRSRSYRRASLIDLYPPTKFHQDRSEKIVDGRTDIETDFIRHPTLVWLGPDEARLTSPKRHQAAFEIYRDRPLNQSESAILVEHSFEVAAPCIAGVV